MLHVFNSSGEFLTKHSTAPVWPQWTVLPQNAPEQDKFALLLFYFKHMYNRLLFAEEKKGTNPQLNLDRTLKLYTNCTTVSLTIYTSMLMIHVNIQ